MLTILIVGLLLVGLVSIGLSLFLAKRVQWLLAVTIGLLGGVASLFLFGVLGLGAFLWWSEPPSLASLMEHFPARRATLEHLLKMSDEDVRFPRLDPDFLYDPSREPQRASLEMRDDPQPSLPIQRWDDYRRLFKQAGLKQGFNRDQDGDVFFRAGAEGLLDRGHATGYLYCRNEGSTVSKSAQFEPCRSVNQDADSRPEQVNPPAEAYSFQKLANHWYAYDQGPG